jgi:hypothetical protein
MSFTIVIPEDIQQVCLESAHVIKIANIKTYLSKKLDLVNELIRKYNSQMFKIFTNELKNQGQMRSLSKC